MTTNETQLKERFVMAIDEAIPPAPWLEARITGAIQRVPRHRQRVFGLNAAFEFRPGLRLAAGLAAVLIAIAAVTALLMSARLHAPTVPVRPGPTVTSPSPSQAEVPWNPPDSPFTPTTVRSPSWPPGGPVPAQLAGPWQPKVHQVKTGVLYLGGYSFLIQNIGGNVVVNGSEIDFMVDPCGVDRFSYTLTGDTLVLARSTHAPRLTIVVEGGVIGPDVKAGQLPVSTNEMAAGRHAMMLAGITDTFLFAQRGFFDYGFLGLAQIDPYGDINTSVLGPRARPAVRLPGSGGANDIASLCREVFIVTVHERRRFVERLDRQRRLAAELLA
jgi:hypothetical protein